MDIDPAQLKIFNEAAKPVFEILMATFIRPKIEKLSEWFKEQKLQNMVGNSNLFENRFQDYLDRTYKKCKSINVLIFPNQQIELESIYQPLKLNCSKNNQTVVIDKFHQDLISQYQKMLISDSAGMGKSTILKFLTLKIIEQNIGIPILIDLRNLKADNIILQEIKQQLNPIDKVIDEDIILKFIETGNFIFLLDGFDEIQQENANIIIQHIRQFIDKAKDSWFFLTSRPEPALSAMGDFQQFNIVPLTTDEAINLIERYDLASNFKIAENLIKDLKKRTQEISSFLANPFLVSLLYKTYSYTKDIPASKIIFYDEIYSALFKQHDLTKDGWRRQKKSNLEIQNFRIVLRQLAFDTLKENKVSYNRQDLIGYIGRAREKCAGLHFSDADFLDDLLSTVPLFVEEGFLIKWAHKSFQDYFAAEFLTHDNRKEDKLNLIYAKRKSNYFNMLDLFYEMDYKSFRRTIIKNLLTDFKNFDISSYRDFTDFDGNLIDERKVCTAFIKAVYIFRRPQHDQGTELNIALSLARDEERNKGSSGNMAGFMRSPYGFGMIYYPDFRIQLLHIPGSRKESFVQLFSDDVISQHIEQVILKFGETPIPILEGKDFWYNSKEYFAGTTRLLRTNSINGNYILNKKEVYKTLAALDKEWQEDLNNSIDV